MGTGHSALMRHDSEEVWAGDVRTAEIAQALRESERLRKLRAR